VSPKLAALGVRWVVVLHGGGAVRGKDIGELHIAALDEDAGLDHAFASDTIDVFRVAGWRGAVLDSEGRAVELDALLEPLARLDRSGRAVWSRPAARGWMRGFDAAGTTRDGRVALPAGRGVIWYLPAAVAVASYLVTMGGAVIVIAKRNRSTA
jgi:hypothetical protein